MINKILKNMTAIAIATSAGLYAQSAMAQVTVHQHCNYGGYSVPLSSGSYDLSSITRRGGKNDDISSIRIPNGYRVTIYEHAGFRGRSRTFSSNQSCLVASNFNDILSSIRVTKTTPPRTTGPTRTTPTTSSSNAFVTLYQHCNYGGRQTPISTFGSIDLGSLQRRGMRNDDVSAIRVKPGYVATVYEHAGFRGRSRTFRGNDACFVNDGFNDITSSIRISRDTGTNSSSSSTTLNERTCKGLVQNRVSWTRDSNGPKRWSETNLNRLCRGSRDAQRTVTCFKQAMRDHGSWQRGADECSGPNPRRSVRSFNPIPVTAPSNSIVTLFEHCDYRGNQTGITSTGSLDLSSLRRRGMSNDNVSAIRVKPGYIATAYEHAGFRGRSRTFRGNDSCFVNDGFNDILSSIRVSRDPAFRSSNRNLGSSINDSLRSGSSSQQSEINRLREELRDVREERDFLRQMLDNLTGG